MYNVGAKVILYAYGFLMILIGIIILILLVRNSLSERQARKKEHRLAEKERSALNSGVYYTASPHFDSFDELMSYLRKKSAS